MNLRHLLAATLVLGLSAGLFAGSASSSRDCPHPPRQDWRGDSLRPTPTPEQAAFLETQRTLHDSLRSARRAYAEAVRGGASPRNLTSERQRLAEAMARLERHRADNLETWLDVAAFPPGREGRAFRKGEGRRHGRKGCPPPPPSSEDPVAP